MNRKSDRVHALLAAIPSGESDPCYAGYFALFNRGFFYEAHDVLEARWLPARQQPEGDFYKGLIQLAGAFVHLQKNRLRPAAALFKLAAANLEKYPSPYQRLETNRLLQTTRDWLAQLETGAFEINPLNNQPPPRLNLLPEP
jgi:predicted metal-dependent hydrolase